MPDGGGPLRPRRSARGQHQPLEQPVGLRVHVVGEPGVHRAGLDHRAARGDQPAEPLPGRQLGGRAATGVPLANSLKPEMPCPACTVQQKAERDYAALLVATIEDDRLASAYASGDGLCLPHLAMALEQVSDEVTLKRILEPQVARYREMLTDLSEYIRKCDHRFRGEPFGPEGDVWLRVMNTMAGGAGMGTSAQHGGRQSEDLTGETRQPRRTQPPSRA